MRHPEKRWYMTDLSHCVTLDVLDKYLQIQSLKYNADTYDDYLQLPDWMLQEEYCVGPYGICTNPRVTPAFIAKYAHILFKKCLACYLPVNVNIPVQRKLTFDEKKDVIANRGFTFEIMKKYLNLVSYSYISTRELTPNFIREYADKLYWDILSSNDCLTEPLMREFSDKLDWTSVLQNKNITESFIMEHFDKFAIDNILMYTTDIAILEKYCDGSNVNIANTNGSNVNIANTNGKWNVISCNANLPREFIDRHIDKLYYTICKSRHATIDHIRHFIKVGKIDWSTVCEMPNITIEILEENFDKLNGALYDNED
jgi:hypothetical protein